MLSRKLGRVLIASLSLAAFAAGCSDGTAPTSSDDQFIGEASCSAEELDPLVACAAEPCDGLAGDPLNECMAENCDDSVFDVRQTCAECIIINLSGIDDIARACGAATEPSAACSADEMDPVVSCAGEPCADLSGDALMECIQESCPPSVFEVTETCAHCIVSNQSSIENMSGVCTGAVADTACSADEMDPLVACAAEPCADLGGDPLMECMDQNCPESVWEVSEACGSCLIANQSSLDAMGQACAGAEAPEG